MTTEALSVADDMLHAFFERWHRLECAKAEVSDDLKELFAEMKGVGLDTKAARAVFREQVGDKTAKDEFDAICDLYRASLERPRAHPAHARVEKIEKFPSDGGAFVAVTGSAQLAKADSLEPSSSDQNRAASQFPGAATAGGLSADALAAGPSIQESAALPPQPIAPEPPPQVTQGSGAPIPPCVPEFLRKDKPYVLRPHCQRPELCGGYGAKHCGTCERASHKAEAA